MGGDDVLTRLMSDLVTGVIEVLSFRYHVLKTLVSGVVVEEALSVSIDVEVSGGVG